MPLNSNLLSLLLLLVLACFLPVTATAHEVRPGYLEMIEINPQTWDVLWKVPAKNDKRLALYVGFPAHCTESEPSSRFIGGAYIERWRVSCESSLYGETLTIRGLPGTRTDVLARILRLDDTSQTQRLTPGKPVFEVTRTETWTQVALTYAGLGVEHILLGIDHLLFVLALLFLVGNWPRLIGTVTAFTLAHSLTLAAATLGWIRVPQSPVEAVIALSIVLVATEIIHKQQGRPGLAARMPWVVAFVFGLLHGFGFAGALNEIGLPQTAIPVALAFFNIGVELGQLLFIFTVYLIFLILHKLFEPNQSVPDNGTWAIADRFSRPASYLIGSLAAFWLFERTLAFWN